MQMPGLPIQESCSAPLSITLGHGTVSSETYLLLKYFRTVSSDTGTQCGIVEEASPLNSGLYQLHRHRQVS